MDAKQTSTTNRRVTRRQTMFFVRPIPETLFFHPSLLLLLLFLLLHPLDPHSSPFLLPAALKWHLISKAALEPRNQTDHLFLLCVLLFLACPSYLWMKLRGEFFFWLLGRRMVFLRAFSCNMKFISRNDANHFSLKHPSDMKHSRKREFRESFAPLERIGHQYLIFLSLLHPSIYFPLTLVLVNE